VIIFLDVGAIGLIYYKYILEGVALFLFLGIFILYKLHQYKKYLKIKKIGV